MSNSGQQNEEAFCVKTEDFANFAAVQTEQQQAGEESARGRLRDLHATASQLGLPSTGVGSSRYVLEAVLTGLDTRQTLNASLLRIQAQKAVNIHGHFVRQTLPGGMRTCQNCASLSIKLVPDGIQSVAVDAFFEAQKAGTLYVSS